MNFCQQPVQSTPAKPLLREERDRCRPSDFAFSDSSKQPKERLASGTLLSARSCAATASECNNSLFQRNRIQNINPGSAHFFRALRANIYVQILHVIHLRRIRPPRRQMHAQSSKHARNLFAVARDDNDWLSETQRIKHGIRWSLRQSLDPQITIGRNLAHDIAGLIDRRRN